MKSYTVYITLSAIYEAEDEQEAWHKALEDISDRDGMQIVSSDVELEE